MLLVSAIFNVIVVMAPCLLFVVSLFLGFMYRRQRWTPTFWSRALWTGWTLFFPALLILLYLEANGGIGPFAVFCAACLLMPVSALCLTVAFARCARDPRVRPYLPPLRRFTAFLGVTVALLMLAFPPYVLPGRMMDGMTYAPFWNPPQPAPEDVNSFEYRPYVASELLNMQLGVMAAVTVTALLCLRGKRRTAATYLNPADIG